MSEFAISNYVDTCASGQDETIGAMNARLSSYVDHTLGYGIFRETTKQQLITLASSPAFCPHDGTKQKFDLLETTADRGVVLSKQRATTVGPKLHNKTKFGGNNIQEESAVVFTFTRILAKRDIQTPDFDELLPLKRQPGLDWLVKVKNFMRYGQRWPVELYGDRICVTEYYGGEARIEFTWNREAKVKIADVVSAIESSISETSGAHHQLIQNTHMTELKCCAEVKGFKLPVTLRGNLTTMTRIMELVRALNQLPIECAVAVGHESVAMETVRHFPLNLWVDHFVDESAMLDKLDAIQRRLLSTERSGSTARSGSLKARHLVESLTRSVKHAAANNRPLLSRLSVLIDKVEDKLDQHGLRVHLFKRYDQLHLYSYDCDENAVTALGSEVISMLTFGAAIPIVRNLQKRQFEEAPVWTEPEHYTTHQFASTQTISGFHDRIKCQLIFSDDKLVEEWRQELDLLMQNPAIATTIVWIIVSAVVAYVVHRIAFQ